MSSTGLAVLLTVLAVTSCVTCFEKVAPMSRAVATDARVPWDYHGGPKASPVSLGYDTVPEKAPLTVQLLCAQSDGVNLINLSNPDNNTMTNIPLVKVYTTDYHYRQQLVYYTAFDMILRDTTVGRLTRVDLPQPVVTEGVGGPVSLAVDWVHDMVYWMSHRQHYVEVSDLSGFNRTTLIINLPRSAFPNNLAVDPYRRYLFMVVNGSICRTNLDGKELKRFSTEGVRCLTLDRQGQRVLYSGKRGNYTSGKVLIGSCNYDGLECKDLPLEGKWNDIFSLDYFQDTLYFAHFTGENTPDSVWTATLSQATLKPTFWGFFQGLFSLKVYHPEVQQE